MIPVPSTLRGEPSTEPLHLSKALPSSQTVSSSPFAGTTPRRPLRSPSSSCFFPTAQSITPHSQSYPPKFQPNTLTLPSIAGVLPHLLSFLTSSHSPRNELLPNNILTPLTPHPHLMHLPRRHINPTSHPERLPLRIRVLRIRNSQAPPPDQMRR